MTEAFLVTTDQEQGVEVWSSLDKMVGRRYYYLTVDGIRLTSAEWAERAGVTESMIINRIDTGWNASDAVRTPVLELGKRSVSGYSGKHRLTTINRYLRSVCRAALKE